MTEPTLTFDESAAEQVAKLLGYELTSTGYLRETDTGGVATSICGQPVHIDEFAGVAIHGGEPTPVRDDFNELVELVRDKHERDSHV